MGERQLLQGPVGEILLRRDPAGVPVIEAGGARDLVFAQGWLHARDRQVQMLFTRCVAQGRLAECFSPSEEAVASDLFMRRLGLAFHAKEDAARLDETTRGWLQDYANGVNAYLQGNWRRMEFFLTGFVPEPWEPEDTVLTLKIMSYLGLAQAQQDIEKLLIQLLAGEAEEEFLRDLFHPHLDGLDETLLGLLKKVRIEEPFLTRSQEMLALLPHMQASNNWVVSPQRSVTGSCLLATDPHLEVNRLPAVWYEIVARIPGSYSMGINMPGLPGIAMGRTHCLSFGFTYGCMDQVDYFLEDCKEGQYRRGEQWCDFDVRTEVIWRKGAEPLVVEVFENDLGVLEGDPRKPGIYLLRAWFGLREGGAESFEAFRRFLEARTVAEAQPLLAPFLTSCNWLLADDQGNIGYQQSGILPRRRHSGLYPLPAWEPDNHWQGRVDPELLHRVLNPPEGVLATTNDHQQNPRGPLSMNLVNGDYRSERIHGLLQAAETFTIEDLKRFQLDLYSVQAERYLDFFEPFLPPTCSAMQLKAWDCRYSLDSQEAVWFEAIYVRLIGAAFGDFFGSGVWSEMIEESGLLNDFHVLLDEMFFDFECRWLSREARKDLTRRVLEEILEDPPEGTWGEKNQVVMQNIFFRGKLPQALGFDVGPLPLSGGRASLRQGRVYRSHGRTTTFVPSWRFVTDLGEHACETALPGGGSDSRFSRWYTDGVSGWLGGEYKHLATSPLPDKSLK
jgi:penicillin amidase